MSRHPLSGPSKSLSESVRRVTLKTGSVAAHMRTMGETGMANFWWQIASKAAESESRGPLAIARVRGVAASTDAWVLSNPMAARGVALGGLVGAVYLNALWEQRTARAATIHEYAEWVLRAANQTTSLRGAMAQLPWLVQRMDRALPARQPATLAPIIQSTDPRRAVQPILPFSLGALAPITQNARPSESNSTHPPHFIPPLSLPRLSSFRGMLQRRVVGMRDDVRATDRVKMPS